MDPKVLKELLTHGQGSNKVDEEAFGDEFPLQQDVGIGFQIGSPRNRNLQRWKKSEKNGVKGFSMYEIYRRKNGWKAVAKDPMLVASRSRHLAA